ncbi:MAG: CNNM domain-containing protein, partial [Acidobacteriota bacterium]
MSWSSLGFFTVACFILLIFLLSILESSVSRLSRLTLRVLAEREKSPKLHLLEAIARDRIQFLLPLKFGAQLSIVSSAVLVSWLFFSLDVAFAPWWALAVMVAIVFLFRQLFPRMITQSQAERVLLRFLPLFRNFYPVLCWVSSP